MIENHERPPARPSKIAISAVLARARTAARQGNIAWALQEYTVAQQHWDKHHGAANSAAWLEKTASVPLIIECCTPAQKAEGQTMAQTIFSNVKLKLVPTSPLLKALKRMTVVE